MVQAVEKHTGCSTLLKTVIRYLQKNSERVLYFYDTYQKKINDYLNKIEFIQETPTLEILKLTDRCLLVLGDLMYYPQDLIIKIFAVVYVHHFNFLVMFTAQNLFNKNIR